MRKSNPGASLMAWMVVDPSEVSSVKQLTKLVKRRFLLVGEHKLYLDGAWLPPVECIRVLRDNDVISVVWGECDSEKTSSAPNCVVQNGGVKRHLEEPDLLPPKKKKKKKPRYQSLSAEEIPAVLDIIEYQAAGTTISAEAVAEATQPATPVKPRLQTTQNDSSCSDSEAVVKFPNKSPPESRLQGDLDTAAGSVTEFSSFVTPDGPKKKRPRKRKKKPKVAASVEPTVNLTPAVFVPLKVSVEPKGKHKRFEHESHWDEMEADGVERKEADDRGQGEADDGMQGGAENRGQNIANEDEAFAPDDCSTPVLQKMLRDKSERTPPSLEKSLKVCELQSPGLERAVKAGRGGADFRAVPPPPRTTPRAVPEQGTPLSAATAEPEAKSEPQSTARSYADFPKLKTPPRVGDAIAFKVLELDANYCPNVSGYKEGKVLHHNTRTDMLRIELRVPEVKATYNGKFELEVPEEDEAPPVEETLELLWSELLDPVLLSS
ncbi:hypothetical protein IscW_ISCW023092 [Ixodes scapularis]|uniref:Uncharacterized protein n=1 Tax=Ixodes scapularis TaxID=6945 RepID=B7QM04_IXOSC|nr:hypothetical protein IscW_ISCW023092 [Ixodes scapularis]|eukprot:XP_002416209.1 hypothetical protein IscW_ISCW023092 [Ixodes scapularis]